KYEQDLERDKNLTKLGYHVLRFTDEEVIHHLDKVIRALESCI
ncbi:MAG: DUF559 domain-containing protein, partial [Bacteroidales bacterium]|nr:DUF559 domain-containing protein [Bacteroidales bacterium]